MMTGSRVQHLSSLVHADGISSELHSLTNADIETYIQRSTMSCPVPKVLVSE